MGNHLLITTKHITDIKGYDRIRTEAIALMEKPEFFDREMSWALQTINANPYALGIAKTNPASVLQSVFKICQCGLSLNPAMGHAYLIPYGGRFPLIAMQVGYKGYIALITKKGAVLDVQASCIYDCDDFKETKGSTPQIVHNPKLNRPDNAEMIGAYAVAFLKDGHTHHIVMRMDDIFKRRNLSQAYISFKLGKTPKCIWTDWPDEMAMKTAIRALSNYLQQEQPDATTVQLSTALKVDDIILDIDSGEVGLIENLLNSSTLNSEEREEIYIEIMGGELPKTRADEIITRLEDDQIIPTHEFGRMSQTAINESWKKHVNPHDSHAKE